MNEDQCISELELGGFPASHVSLLGVIGLAARNRFFLCVAIIHFT